MKEPRVSKWADKTSKLLFPVITLIIILGGSFYVFPGLRLYIPLSSDSIYVEEPVSNDEDRQPNTQVMEDSVGIQTGRDNYGDVNVYKERYSDEQTITNYGVNNKVALNLDNSGILRIVDKADNDLYQVTLVLNPDRQLFLLSDDSYGELYGYKNDPSNFYTFYSEEIRGTKSHSIETGDRIFQVTLMNSVSIGEVDSKKVEYNFGIVEK